MHTCICTKKKKKNPNESYVRGYSLIYEEGKEKEKMLFFFSALRAVVHLEKAISEPAITTQKEKREREKEVLLVHEPREEKREYKHERERKRAITKTNERERTQQRTKTHTPPMNGARSLCIYILEQILCFFFYLTFFLEFKYATFISDTSIIN